MFLHTMKTASLFRQSRRFLNDKTVCIIGYGEIHDFHLSSPLLKNATITKLTRQTSSATFETAEEKTAILAKSNDMLNNVIVKMPDSKAMWPIDILPHHPGELVKLIYLPEGATRDSIMAALPEAVDCSHEIVGHKAFVRFESIQAASAVKDKSRNLQLTIDGTDVKAFGYNINDLRNGNDLRNKNQQQSKRTNQNFRQTHSSDW